jgi:hypothetical protein
MYQLVLLRTGITLSKHPRLDPGLVMSPQSLSLESLIRCRLFHEALRLRRTPPALRSARASFDGLSPRRKSEASQSFSVTISARSQT